MEDGELERQLAEIFFVESGEMLSEASLALLRAEAEGNPQGVIHQVFRAVHSIKGGAQSLGFEQLAEIVHHMEDFLVPLRQGDRVIDDQSVSLILEAMDVIESQLHAYQTGGILVENTSILKKLTERAAKEKEAPSVNSSVIEDTFIRVSDKKALNRGTRLLYLSFLVDPSAAMPGITAFILLEQLRQAGRILYTKPDIDRMDTVVPGEYFKQIAIVETMMSNTDVKQEAYKIGDIRELKIAEIDNGIFTSADKPAKKEITQFNFLVGKMRDILVGKRDNWDTLQETLQEIINWGGDSRGAAGWFPGGLPRWNRMTHLLFEMVSLVHETLATEATRSAADEILQILWGAVYNALCNHTYFYTLSFYEVFDGNCKSIIKELEVSAIDIQVVVIDLSELMTLEPAHLRKLAEFRDLLAKKDWVLWLISEGQYTRRHLSVLELAESMIGTLEFYPSICTAVLASKKFAMLGEDEHVSKV